jgi:prepilin-type processing-associated H-X9-DG protein
VREPAGRGKQNYIDSVDAFFCPSDHLRIEMRDGAGFAPNTVGGTVFNCVSYWYWATPLYWTSKPANVMYDGLDNDRFAQKGAAQKMIVADQGYTSNVYNDFYEKTWPYFHPRGQNMLYLDGHVQWVKQVDVVAKVRGVSDAEYGPTIIKTYNSLF